MAIINVIKISELEAGYVLTPERYNLSRNIMENNTFYNIAKVCFIKNESFTLKKIENDKNYVVFDTGDAEEGYISYKKFIDPSNIGSTKKIIKPGDVIISKLRPYLRQVGFFDTELYEAYPDNTIFLCSTEFYVLKSDEDISFLAPLLLTNNIQKVLIQAQEGGHHPRFKQNVLENLCIDEKNYENRFSIGEIFKKAISSIRHGEQKINILLQQLNNGMPPID